jgi:hypothetical protein
MSVLDKTVTSSAPPSTTTESGVGDSTFQGALIYTIDQHWAYGFGARVVDPTAQDSLGAANGRSCRDFGMRYSFLEFGPDTYFVPVIRYAMSFAGNPAARTISEPQIAPTLNIGLRDRWFVTFYPSNDIRSTMANPFPARRAACFFRLTPRSVENSQTTW